jgi:hypothetical protein
MVQPQHKDAYTTSLRPEFEDDVDRGLGDVTEPAEAGILGRRRSAVLVGVDAVRVGEVRRNQG